MNDDVELSKELGRLPIPAAFLSAAGAEMARFGTTGNFELTKKLYPANDAGARQVVCAIYAGHGAPTDANGANGDMYFRDDGGAMTTIYQRRAGAWVGIV